jgi:hypothetical protein
VDKSIIERNLGIFGIEFDFRTFEEEISGMESLWVPELKPCVLTDLAGFELVRNFVLDKLSKIYLEEDAFR